MEDSAHDFVKLNQFMAEKEELEAALEEKMERWMYLEEAGGKDRGAVTERTNRRADKWRNKLDQIQAGRRWFGAFALCSRKNHISER